MTVRSKKLPIASPKSLAQRDEPRTSRFVRAEFLPAQGPRIGATHGEIEKQGREDGAAKTPSNPTSFGHVPPTEGLPG